MFNALRLSSSIATPAARLQPERSNASFRCGRPLVCGDGKLSCNAIAVACLAAIRRECEDELGREHAIDAMGQGCKRSAVSEWNRLPSSIEMSDTLAYQIGVEPNLTKHQTYYR